MSEGVSEVSERANERAQRRARAKQAVWSKRTSERCERMSERTSEWPSAYILVCSRPQRTVCSSKWHSGQALLVVWPELEIVLIWSKIETGWTA